MKEYDFVITSNFISDTGYWKSKNKAISKVPFDEINDFLDREDKIRDVKAEIEELIDMAEGVFGSKAEAFKDGIYVYRDKSKGWRIEVNI